MGARKSSRGLAWFGIGLGIVEVVAPFAVARAAGLSRHPHLIRLFGLREIASGLVLLSARDPARWLWLRTVGDGLDGALLGSGLRPSNPDRARTLLATLAVAPVVVLDTLYTLRARRPVR